jgi:hypothetical protein
MLRVYKNGRLCVASPVEVANNPEVIANWLAAFVPKAHKVGCIYKALRGDPLVTKVDIESAEFWADTPWPESKEDVRKARLQAYENLRR